MIVHRRYGGELQLGLRLGVVGWYEFKGLELDRLDDQTSLCGRA